MRGGLTRQLLSCLARPRGQVRPLYSFSESTRAPATVPFTKELFGVKRGPYAEVTSDDIQQLAALVDGRVETDKDDLLMHNTDWLRSLRGCSPCVVFPKTTAEVSAVLKYCSDRRLAVCPQGASTSLVGGSVPVFDEIIVSTAKMNEVIEVDTDGGTLTCGAGCSLDHLEHAAKNQHLFFPVDYTIREAQLGGIVAADMAGPRTARYGNLHGNVLGLEVVLPDGTVLDSMSTMRKDNTGFDLKQIFVGSEGSLGIITKVAMACPSLPKHINVAMVYTDSFHKVLGIMRMTKAHLGELTSACEFMDNEAVMSVKKKYLSAWGVPSKPFYVLIETAGQCDMHDEEKLKTLFNALKDKELILDGQIGPLNYDDPTFVERLWNINTRILAALSRGGNVYHYDVSLPHDKQYKLVEKLRKELSGEILKVASFGHLLDSNLHLALQSHNFDPETSDELDRTITDYVTRAGGAVSAELGCGFRNRNLGAHCKDPVEVKLMRQMKQLLDPHGIMNPYKVFPDGA
ncbi:D-2-hydroxyglutarate dehydrogenase, mitochondrial-like [Amphibalanus amphitrite]|uniref:D-2-hydroxyglutarate dehydrogenase, mitochondrial-like n=1 Tax=Amphibalanus amphitrite TaxID=1232801 RepID=UPI001C9251E2|nr:D-2-hydroxyglutarate dehydrogenase, mitochondrial-like [Amphibalanus amphitrite]XP_043241874.1 D-2-hydroxyglutarate dehydrogenase, mitochondrial-like [Amphibalanus amphitrite]XP_043241875.1 D-2-hydroxyglutarate dehydrogenase, mitochondrial-like [Amphibalanus amphitrite]XP_043241876.1 D-2-hydroxyglutarate dehydrogenase, mitochondrial-like [Amphibalanus amphitrite]XP_043241877.1 D-2-hydroxyglutarate dehydrogenase, mitochondrial-like [Amphibalanus amphitrite]XP_043241878.1 D-2-hydroxyglutarate